MNNIIPIKKGSYIPDIEIKGRTLVNLLGRSGNGIYKQSQHFNCSANSIVGFDGEYITLTNQETVTNSKILALTASSNQPSVVGKNYLFICEKASVTIGQVAFYSCTLLSSSWNNVDNICYGLYRFDGSKTFLTHIDIVFGNMQPAEVAKIKNARLYEVSENDAQHIINKTNGLSSPLEIAQRYPYVDDVKCVINPYIENKENLISDNYWFRGSNGDYSGKIDVPSDSSSVFTMSYSELKNGQEYTITLPKVFTDFKVVCGMYDGTSEKAIRFTTEISKTFTMEGNVFRIFANGANESDVSDLKKITLVEGTNSKKYEDCHNSRIMFETKLHEGETIFTRNDGTYVKNSIWEETTLNKLQFTCINSINGYKRVIVSKSSLPNIDDPLCLAKLVSYDGSLIENKREDVVDYNHFYIDIGDNGNIVLSLKNTLTGWGESHTPTNEEIRAFFLGWKMYKNYTSEPYNGDGQKAWAPLWCGIGASGSHGGVLIYNSGTLDLPTTMNPHGYTPYKLIYKKSTPTIEEVKTYGSLVVREKECIVASSGLVLAEDVFSKKNGVKQYINLAGEDTSNTSNRVSKYLKLLKDGEVKQFNTEAIVPSASEIRVGDAGWCNITNETIQYKYSLDYLIYRPDTVTSFEYRLGSVGTLNDLISKNIESVVDCYNALSKTDIDVSNLRQMMSQISNPNLLINGDFKINQRGKSEYINSVYLYTVDRWAVNNSQSKVIVKDGYIRAENYQSVFATLGQTVEFTNPSKAKKLTVSFYIRDFVGNPIACNARCYFNSTVSCALGAVEIDTPFKKGYNEFTVNIPDNVKSFTVYFYTGTADNLASSGNTFFELEWVKAELGEYATPFVPRSYPEELAMCQRYYFRNRWMTLRTAAITNTALRTTHFYFPVEMRLSPTVKALVSQPINQMHTVDLTTNLGSPAVSNIYPAQVVMYNERMCDLQFTKTTAISNLDYNIEIKDYAYEFDAEIY